MANSPNLNLSGEVKGHALGTCLKYPKSANYRALPTAYYTQLPRLNTFGLEIAERHCPLVLSALGEPVVFCHMYTLHNCSDNKIIPTQQLLS